MYSKIIDKNFPIVHVLMANYNSEKYVENSINSVLSLSKKYIGKLKLIIYDDGSNDGSCEIIKKMRKNKNELIFSYFCDENKGVSFARSQLIKISLDVNPNAYVLWLDSDDTFQDLNFLNIAIRNMINARASICILNFEIIYEDKHQIKNSSGLIKDKDRHEKLLQEIYKRGVINSTKIIGNLDILSCTTLGWTKLYAPTVVKNFPNAVFGFPYEDFVYMAAFFIKSGIKIIALKKEVKAIRYLRRSSSVCGKRKSVNFTIHIPAQLNKFFDLICEYNKMINSETKVEVFRIALRYLDRKIKQYHILLKTLNNSNKGEFSDSVVKTYELSTNEVLKKCRKVISYLEKSLSTVKMGMENPQNYDEEKTEMSAYFNLNK